MQITAQTELLQHLNTLYRLGCPEDQTRRFLSAGYIPQPKQTMFHAAARECDCEGGPEYVAMGGTRGQAKSHAELAQAVIDDMQRVPDLKFLYLRKLQKKAGESFEDLRRKVLKFTPHSTANGVLKLPNGSFMVVGGFRSESEIDAYLGIEYDGLLIEDATSLSKMKIDVILASLRTSKENWRPRGYFSFNPGGIGHAWARQMFFDPYIRGEETFTRFIHTTLGDNIFINSEYERFLKSLQGWLKQAWCDGDFSISAGQYFINFNEAIHVRPMPDVLPVDWTYWCALDYGFVHWTVCLLFGKDNDGNIHVIDEHAARRWLTPQHAGAIKSMLARNGLSIGRLQTFVAGHDVFAQRGTSTQTIADQYQQEGITLSRANIDRINGWGKILQRLGNVDEGIPARLTISPRCRRLIQTLPVLQHDPRRGEDVLKEDCDPDTGEGGDDPGDCLRYGVMEDGEHYGVRNLNVDMPKRKQPRRAIKKRRF